MSIDRMTEQRISAARALATRAVSPDQIKAVQQQLIESIQSGALPSYGGVPILEDLTRRLKMVGAAQALQEGQAAPQQTIKQQVMDAALQRQQPQPGLDKLQSNLPVQMAGGGIVAFDEGGEVDRYQNRGLVESFLSPTTARMLSTGRSLSPEEEAELAQREQSPGLVDRLLDGITVQGPFGPVKVPLVSSTTREALRTGQAPIPGLGAPSVATPTSAEPPAAPRTPGGPTRFERPSLLSLLSAEKTPGGGGGGGGISFGKVSAPSVNVVTPYRFMTDETPLPDFESLRRSFNKEDFRKTVDAEAKELEKSQEPLLTAQRQRLENREKRFEANEKTAPWFSLMKAGLKLAGSNKPFAAALSEAGQEGIADLASAKAAQEAMRDKLEDRRFQQEQLELNLKAGNRKEARDNQTAIQGLDNQIAQLNTAVVTAQSGAIQARRQTEATLASGAANAINQGVLSQADMSLRAQIANTQAALQAQSNSIQGSNAANSYNLGVMRLEMLERDMRSRDEASRRAAHSKLMDIQYKAAKLFQEDPNELVYRKSIGNKPPLEQERLLNARQTAFYARVMPGLATETQGDVPSASSLISRMMSSNFGRSDFFSPD